MVETQVVLLVVLLEITGMVLRLGDGIKGIKGIPDLPVARTGKETRTHGRILLPQIKITRHLEVLL